MVRSFRVIHHSPRIHILISLCDLEASLAGSTENASAEQFKVICKRPTNLLRIFHDFPSAYSKHHKMDIDISSDMLAVSL